MSLRTVLAKVVWWTGPTSWTPEPVGSPLPPLPITPAEQVQVIGWLTRLYSTPAGRSLLEGMTGPLRIAGVQTGGASAHLGAPDPWIGLDVSTLGDYSWFNKSGVLLKGDPVIVLAHELSHLLKLTPDIDVGTGTTPADYNRLQDTNGYDFSGPTVDFQNVVAKQLGLTDQYRVSYTGAFGANAPNYFPIAYGISYSAGAAIKVVRFGYQSGDSIDHTAKADNAGDLIFGFAGDDFIHGGGGNDHVYGGAGNDEIFGGLGHDRLFGEGDGDTLAGNVGSDLLHGGYNAAVSGPGLLMTDGVDTADYLSVFPAGPAGQGVQVFVGGAPKSARYGSDPDFDHAVFVKDLNPNRDGAIDTLISIERILGTAGDDRVTIERLDSRVLAGPNGQGGVAIIDLGAQSTARGDVIDLSRLDEGAIVSLSGDGFVGSLDSLRFLSIKGAETVIGSKFDDNITGDGNDNTIIGGGGRDILAGGAGKDRITGSGELFGDADGDVLTLVGDGGHVTGGRGNDVIRLENQKRAYIHYAAGDGSDQVINSYVESAAGLTLDNYLESSFNANKTTFVDLPPPSGGGGMVLDDYRPYELYNRGIMLSFDLPFASVTTTFTAARLDGDLRGNPESGDLLLLGDLSFFYAGQKIMTVNNILGVAHYGELGSSISLVNVLDIDFSDGGFSWSYDGYLQSEVEVVISSPSAAKDSASSSGIHADSFKSGMTIWSETDFWMSEGRGGDQPPWPSHELQEAAWTDGAVRMQEAWTHVPQLEHIL